MARSAAHNSQFSQFSQSGMARSAAHNSQSVQSVSYGPLRCSQQSVQSVSYGWIPVSNHQGLRCTSNAFGLDVRVRPTGQHRMAGHIMGFSAVSFRTDAFARYRYRPLPLSIRYVISR